MISVKIENNTLIFTIKNSTSRIENEMFINEYKQKYPNFDTKIIIEDEAYDKRIIHKHN